MMAKAEVLALHLDVVEDAGEWPDDAKTLSQRAATAVAGVPGLLTRALQGKVCSGFPERSATKQRSRVVPRFDLNQNDPRPVRVTLALSSDAEVAALNGRFRGKTGPTNVLSFPAAKSEPNGFIGDIVLARETLEREAAEQGIASEDHLQHLVIHGILHLLGYDHETPGDAERMERLEIQILSSLGIADPYTGELETATSDLRRNG